MSVGTDPKIRFQTSGDDQLADYEAPSGLAIVGLLLGFASSLVLWRSLLLIVSAAAIFMNVLALCRIRASDGRLTGRRAAILGLCLAILFATAAIARVATRHALIVYHARPLADQFFMALASNEPHKAMQMMEYPANRKPLDATLWDHYRTDDEARQNLIKFVEYPLIRTLLALGDACEVRFYQSGSVQQILNSLEAVTLVYAVTYNDAGQKKSFFVSVRLDRSGRDSDRNPRWRITTFHVLNEPPFRS
ncbi:MAG: hypothetical protein JW829_07800 [Pirellulales bacterium]|nr:hypothetical protein [Pirellulales bacterium]